MAYVAGNENVNDVTITFQHIPDAWDTTMEDEPLTRRTVDDEMMMMMTILL